MSPQALNGMIKVGTVDCQKHHSFCQGEGVRGYPEIRLYPQNANRRDVYQYVPYCPFTSVSEMLDSDPSLTVPDQILLVIYTLLADVNASVEKCLCF